MRVACSIARTSAAFVLAPLVVPALWVGFVAWDQYQLAAEYPPGPAMYALIAMICAIVAYSGMVFLGVPIYVWLRVKGRTGFVLAPLWGFAAGAVAMLVFIAALRGFPPLDLLILGGLSGAVVGVVFWLIDRPDRRVQTR